MTLLSMIALVLSSLPLAIIAINLRLMRPPSGVAKHRVSVLIPARNEEANIATVVRSALANDHPDFEVVVMDDHSTDATARIVRELQQGDTRLRLGRAPDLPAGWCGKQHACHFLAQHAAGDLLLFVDADVTLATDALSRIDGFMSARPQIGLCSGVPRQIAATLAERLTVPLINFLLLGFLPLWVMRDRPNDPSLGAGCGQLMAVRRDAYFSAGGHAAIRTTLHDGLKLPRLLREAGIATDLFDGTAVATCHMYDGWKQVWSGFGKNAKEGMATRRALPLWTVLLAGGQVLPFALLLGSNGIMLWIALAACLASYSGRVLIARRVQEPPISVALHPLAIIVILAIQWISLCRPKRSASWHGRIYP